MIAERIPRMKKLIAVSLFGLLLTGCNFVGRTGKRVTGSGKIVSEQRSVPPFTAISTSGALNVEVTCQKEQSLELEADDNLLPLVKTEVRDGTLHVRNEKDYSSGKSIRVRITVPDVAALTSSGAGEFTLADVRNERLEIENSGAATVRAAGETKTLRVELNGATRLQAGNLKAEDVTVEMSGAGSADVYATSELTANISGVGKVTYSGDPKVVNKNVSGFGSITKN